MDALRLTLLVLGLAVSLTMRRCVDDCNTHPRPLDQVQRWSLESAGMSSREIWAHVVAGEAGHLPDGARLVAWTLRSWEVERGMPPELAGPRWGWHGWKDPLAVDYAAVDEAWGQPLEAAPYAWLRGGHYCRLLGNDHDVRYWRSLGWEVQPRYRLEWPEWNMAMNCIW